MTALTEIRFGWPALLLELSRNRLRLEQLSGGHVGFVLDDTWENIQYQLGDSKSEVRNEVLNSERASALLEIIRSAVSEQRVLFLGGHEPVTSWRILNAWLCVQGLAEVSPGPDEIFKQPRWLSVAAANKDRAIRIFGLTE